MTKAPFGRGQTPKLPLRWCLGGVSKSRPRAYQARALPLSYPGIYAAVYIYEKLSAKTSPNLIRIMVPIAGLEPARPFGQQILSLWCLPIPPYRHIWGIFMRAFQHPQRSPACFSLFILSCWMAAKTLELKVKITYLLSSLSIYIIL